MNATPTSLKLLLCFLPLQLLIALGLVALAAARPSDILEFEADDHHHKQEGEAGEAVTGEYR